MTFFVKCFIDGENLTAEFGHADVSILIQLATGGYTMCAVDDVELRDRRKLSDTDRNKLISKQCVMDTLCSVGIEPHYIIFEERRPTTF